MNYRVNHDAVLFQMFGDYYMFPVKKPDGPISFLISLSPELAAFLQEPLQMSESALKKSDLVKLKRLIKLGYVEEH